MTELQAMALKALLDSVDAVRYGQFILIVASPIGMDRRIKDLESKADDVRAMFDGQLPE